jgi:antirestriction protein ArdC
MATTMAQEKMNEIVAKVITAIENNETGYWTKSWIGGGLPTNYTTKVSYSGMNIVTLMLMQELNNWTTNQFLTFNQIQKIKGAKLKKGSTSTPVFFFKIIEKLEEVEGEMKIIKIPLLKFYYVFNIDQVEGIEIDTNKAQDLNLNEFVSNTQVTIKNRSEAFYSPTEDYIGIPDLQMFKSTQSYASTLLHELSHSTGHESRLNRDLGGKFGSESYAKEEVIAELSNMFLCSHLHIQNEQRQSEAYIKNWLVDSLKAEPKILWKIASEAQKAFNFLVSSQQTEQAA